MSPSNVAPRSHVPEALEEWRAAVRCRARVVALRERAERSWARRWPDQARIARLRRIESSVREREAEARERYHRLAREAAEWSR